MSYDYILLKNSIPLVYNNADSIIIALDKNLRTWSGGTFKIDDIFFDWLKKYDTKNKISIYREDFYDPALNAMENEVRERKMLASKMGIGNWLIQLDADEYFMDFENFTRELKSRNHFLNNPEKNQVQIAGYYINLYKYIDNGILYVTKPRPQKFATNYPDYVTGRNTKKRVIYIRSLVVHECLSRNEEEIRTKFTNWGHSHQVNIEKFIEKWRKVNFSNYHKFEDFFYLEPEKWKKLNFVKGHTIAEISENLNNIPLMPSKFYITKKNIGQWFKFLFK